jgi:hypothetical protein
MNDELHYDNKYLTSEIRLLDNHNKMLIQENVKLTNIGRFENTSREA